MTATTAGPRRDAPTAPAAVWSGQWATDRLGLRLTGDDETAARQLRALVGLAVRDNPRRAHLLVSTVLGKHVPQRPHVVRTTGTELGRRVGALLGASEGAFVLGYAETATGLGHAVAAALHAPYLHSTRRAPAVPGPIGVRFVEEHSHAPSHLLAPDVPELLTDAGTLVLVDDELSTGRTVHNTIETMHQVRNRNRYVVASLVDVREDADRRRLGELARRLGARIDVVALATGRLRLPGGFVAAAHDVLVEYGSTPGPAPARRPEGDVVEHGRLGWPAGTPEGGRHGFRPADVASFETAAAAVARTLAEQLDVGPGDPAARRVLVLGDEELMAAPAAIADHLAGISGAMPVHLSSTTRSPVLPLDVVGYAVRTAVVYAPHEPGEPATSCRYVYNVAPSAGSRPRYTDVVLVIDDVADTPELRSPGGLLSGLAGVCARVHLVTLPTRTPVGSAGA